VSSSVSSFLWRTNAVFGLKFRTGGPSAADYPSAEALAQGMLVCRDAGLSYKLTAGLHQPLPHVERGSGAKAHGFLNVLCAAVLAMGRPKATAEQLQAVLKEQSAESFTFDTTRLHWRDRTATLRQIRMARENALVSLGSCSFDEPLESLRRLGWKS